MTDASFIHPRDWRSRFVAIPDWVSAYEVQFVCFVELGRSLTHFTVRMMSSPGGELFDPVPH